MKLQSALTGFIASHILTVEIIRREVRGMSSLILAFQGAIAIHMGFIKGIAYAIVGIREKSALFYDCKSQVSCDHDVILSPTRMTQPGICLA